MRLRFPSRQIRHWSSRYEANDLEREIEAQISPAVRASGFYSKDQFLALCRWKTARTQSRCRSNDEAFVRAITATALTTEHERLRIEVVTLLNGVEWPTASVLLHFGHTAPYPILDYRALWSLGVNTPPDYNFRFWWSYVEFCRRLAEKEAISMRALDRALWQFSKEHQ